MLRNPTLWGELGGSLAYEKLANKAEIALARTGSGAAKVTTEMADDFMTKTTSVLALDDPDEHSWKDLVPGFDFIEAVKHAKAAWRK